MYIFFFTKRNWQNGSAVCTNVPDPTQTGSAQGFVFEVAEWSEEIGQTGSFRVKKITKNNNFEQGEQN